MWKLNPTILSDARCTGKSGSHLKRSVRRVIPRQDSNKNLGFTKRAAQCQKRRAYSSVLRVKRIRIIKMLARVCAEMESMDTRPHKAMQLNKGNQRRFAFRSTLLRTSPPQGHGGPHYGNFPRPKAQPNLRLFVLQCHALKVECPRGEV